MSVKVTAIITASFKLNIWLSDDSMLGAGFALRSNKNAQAARRITATKEGKSRILSQLQDTPPTTINSKTIVEIQDISAAPAFDRASISPLRTCKPNCAMVAVQIGRASGRER